LTHNKEYTAAGYSGIIQQLDIPLKATHALPPLPIKTPNPASVLPADTLWLWCISRFDPG
jgi:hypothetical protein